VYGSPASRKAHAESDSTVGHATSSPTTATTSEGKDHGISRQILNPGGDKYDEVRYGAPVSGEPQATSTLGGREDILESKMGDAKGDNSVKRQVL
jgi:hypothetical protein